MTSTEITKNILQYEKTSIDAPPLDFSYKEIKKLEDIKQIEPRQGKRRPIIKENEEVKDDKKKVDEAEAKQADKEEKKEGANGQGANDQENKNQEKEGEQEDENANPEGEQKDNNKEQGEEQNNKEKDANVEANIDKKPENKVPEIVKIMPQSNNLHINSIIQQQNISLQAQQQKNQSSKNQYGGVSNQFVQKKVVKIKKIQTSLLLSYNQIRSIENLYKVMDFVMEDCKNLQWIDLSHNYLTKLSYNFADFPYLKSLYLHCNYLYDLQDIYYLSRSDKQNNLRSLTVHGNPLERIPNFRLYIIGLLPFLQRLDTVLITRKEKDNSYFMSQTFKNRKLPEVKDADLEKPPEEVVLQEKDGNTKQQ